MFKKLILKKPVDDEVDKPLVISKISYSSNSVDKLCGECAFYNWVTNTCAQTNQSMESIDDACEEHFKSFY